MALAPSAPNAHDLESNDDGGGASKTQANSSTPLLLHLLASFVTHSGGELGLPRSSLTWCGLGGMRPLKNTKFNTIWPPYSFCLHSEISKVRAESLECGPTCPRCAKSRAKECSSSSARTFRATRVGCATAAADKCTNAGARRLTSCISIRMHCEKFHCALILATLFLFARCRLPPLLHFSGRYTAVACWHLFSSRVLHFSLPLQRLHLSLLCDLAEQRIVRMS